MGHKCVKGKAHYIEVFSTSEDEGEDADHPTDANEKFGLAEEEEKSQLDIKKNVILSRVPRF